MSDERRYNQRRVIIESPYAGDVITNIEYAKACVKDSLMRGEFPFASHLLYPGILDDNDPDDRRIGMQAGHGWMEVADYVAVYTDRGISQGMKLGMEEASHMGKIIEFRELEDWKDRNDEDRT